MIIPMVTMTNAGVWTRSRGLPTLSNMEDRPVFVPRRLEAWRGNIPYFCDMAVESRSGMLLWPAMTSDWIPGASSAWEGAEQDAGRHGAMSIHHLLLGTMTSGQDPDKLLLYRVRVPTCGLHAGVAYPPQLQHAMRWPHPEHSAFELVATFAHEGDVDRARSMPQQGRIVATKSCSVPALHIYDVGLHLNPDDSGDSSEDSSKSASSGTQRRRQRRRTNSDGDSASDGGGGSASDEKDEDSDSDGAAADGEDAAADGGGPLLSCRSGPAPAEAGLAWNPVHEGMLASTCVGGRVAVYQLDASAAAASPLALLRTFRGHGGGTANDVAFAGEFCPSLLGSVGDDGVLALWDLRCPSSDESGAGGGASTSAAAGQCSRPAQQWRAHVFGHWPVPANALAFSRLSAGVAATGGTDGVVKVWDLRGGRWGGGGGGEGGEADAGPGPSSSSGRSPLSTLQPAKALPSHRCPVTSLAWSPHHASLLASADVRGLVYVWDVDRGRRVSEAPPAAAASGADGEAGRQGRRAAARAGAGAHLLPSRPELVMIYGGHAREVNDLAWCPDGAHGAGVLATVSSCLMREECIVEEGRAAGPAAAAAGRAGARPGGVHGRGAARERGEEESDEEEGQGRPGQEAEQGAGEEEEGALIQNHNVQLWRPSLDLLFPR